MLWWEANASPERISVVTLEIKRPPAKPHTMLEHIVSLFARGGSWLIWIVAYLLVAAELLLVKENSRALIIAEVEWVILFAMLTVGIWAGGNYLERQWWGLRKRVTSSPENQELLTRRFLRTIAFALFFGSTVLQLYPTLLSVGTSVLASETNKAEQPGGF